MVTEASISIQGVPELQSILDRIGTGTFSKTLLGEIGAFINFAIKKRTMAGVDVDGSTFIPYTPSYALFRQEKGRSPRVNLFFTGSMMSAMTWSTGINEVRAHFLNTSDLSGAKNPSKAFFLNQDRNFFALSESDISSIVKIVENYYSEIIGS